jgi:hypothetical protein
MPELFNTIGEKVEQVAPTAVADGTAGAEDEKVVEEIESLCMNCEENVSRTGRTLKSLGKTGLTPANHDPGNDAPLPDQDPLLP